MAGLWRAKPGSAVLWVLPLACLVSCASKPGTAPAITVPAAWVAGQPSAAAPPTQQWLRSFGSAELDSLLASAAQNSLDIQAADARIRQADARARAAGAAILPQVAVGGNANFYAGRSANGSAHETDSGALLSASYEIDFWGKNRAMRESAYARREASESERAVVALSAVTGIANTYFQTVALRERTTLAQATLDTSRQLLNVVTTRYSEGLASPTEVAQQRAAVAGAEIHIRELEQQATEGQAALALLVGRMPGTLEIAAQRLSDFTEPRVAAGLPAELLTRRPDVQTAEATLRAAHADLLQARAAFFPALTLTGSGGLQNPAVQAGVITLAGAGPALLVGAALAQSVFDGGRLRAARDEAVAREQEMLADYRAAVLAALWDVEIALAAIEHLDLQEESQQQSLAQSELALTGAQVRYREGAGDFLTVLDAERSLGTAREQMSQYRLARLQAAVGLCKALGGGWAQKN